MKYGGGGGDISEVFKIESELCKKLNGLKRRAVLGFDTVLRVNWKAPVAYLRKSLGVKWIEYDW